MSIQSFFMKKLLASKLKGVPQADQDKIFSMIEKNPELFNKMAQEIQGKVKGGMDQMSATMQVAKAYESNLKDLL